MRISNTTERLKELMSEKQLRQVDILNLAKPFCEKYGVKLTKPDLSQYLSHQVEPGREKLFILGLALDVDEAWLMGYDVPKERRTFHSFLHQGIENENLLAIQTLLKNVKYDLKFFAQKYQIETPQGLIATLTPEDVSKLESSSIEHLQFIAKSIIKERFLPNDKVFEDTHGNRQLCADKSYLKPEAAHKIDDVNMTLDGTQHDDTIMKNPSEWE